jgi:ketosteroid isomerase-like protein
VSQENVELLLASLEAYNAGILDRAMVFCAGDIEAVAALPDTPPLQGLQDYRSFLEEVSSPWAGARWKTIDIRSLGADRVMCRGEWGGEGAVSGIEALAVTTIIATFRDGLMVRIEFYLDHAEALKAVGMEE